MKDDSYLYKITNGSSEPICDKSFATKKESQTCALTVLTLKPADFWLTPFHKERTAEGRKVVRGTQPQ